MASLRAKQISGSKYTTEDEIETRFQYDGDMQSCVQYIELLSGVEKFEVSTYTFEQSTFVIFK